MRDIISYIETCQKTFAEAPFNPIDSLVLSSIGYFNFENSGFPDVYAYPSVKLHDILALSDRSKVTEGSWLEDSKKTNDFWNALMASRRYRDTVVGFYVLEASEVLEKQFSAVSISVSEDLTYLSFRGTDGSLYGWKEDFNMAYKKVLPSQLSASRYLSGVASAMTCDIILGGHSKGGNFAEYATLCSEESVFKRIVSVYNHDGPAFLENPSPLINEAVYRDKLHKTVPESAIIGLILDTQKDFRIVESEANSIFQHEPFSWRVEGEDFIYKDALNKSARVFDASMNSWLQSCTVEERGIFIDAAYELFLSSEALTVSEYQENLFKNLHASFRKMSSLDSDTRNMLLKRLSSLAGAIKDETLKQAFPESSRPFNRDG